MTYDDLLLNEPFKTPDPERTSNLKAAFREAFTHHFNASREFRRICEKRGVTELAPDFEWADVPYLPVDVFKQMRMSSIDDDQIVRTLTSSATSSQVPSMVVLDNVTRRRQVHTLMWLMADLLGNRRRPFIILDVDPAGQDSKDIGISARSGAIRGFLSVARSATYCMVPGPDGMPVLDLAKFEAALADAAESGEPAVIMGYTYVIYANAVSGLKKAGKSYSLDNCAVIHIGGWKRLQDQAVSKDEFDTAVSDALGVPRGSITDVYGFTEQLGIVYYDCSAGVKHCSAVSEVIVRDPMTLLPAPDRESGLLEFMSPLPTSYPGIAVVVDDVGRIVSRDGCACGRNGPAFEVLGRAKEAELRGCGDVLGEMMAAAGSSDGSAG